MADSQRIIVTYTLHSGVQLVEVLHELTVHQDAAEREMRWIEREYPDVELEYSQRGRVEWLDIESVAAIATLPYLTEEEADAEMLRMQERQARRSAMAQKVDRPSRFARPGRGGQA